MIYSVYSGMDQFNVARIISILFQPVLKGPLHSGRNDIAHYISVGMKWSINSSWNQQFIPAVVGQAVDQDLIQIPLV